jgi:hypothetical protein
VNQPVKSSILPQGPPAQGGDRRYVQTVPLIRNAAGAGSYSVAAGEFEITIPSTRLMVCATFGFLPDAQEDAVIPTGWTLALDAWAKADSKGFGLGRRVRGNSIIPGPFSVPDQLPLTYEAVTGVDQWRGRVTVPAGGSALAVSGFLICTVTWEPAPGDDIPDEQLRKLFEACRVTPGAGAGATVFETFIP